MAATDISETTIDWSTFVTVVRDFFNSRLGPDDLYCSRFLTLVATDMVAFDYIFQKVKAPILATLCLPHAVDQAHYAAAAKLITYGADVNDRSSWYEVPPLYVAIKKERRS